MYCTPDNRNRLACFSKNSSIVVFRDFEIGSLAFVCNYHFASFTKKTLELSQGYELLAGNRNNGGALR